MKSFLVIYVIILSLVACGCYAPEIKSKVAIKNTVSTNQTIIAKQVVSAEEYCYPKPLFEEGPESAWDSISQCLIEMSDEEYSIRDSATRRLWDMVLSVEYNEEIYDILLKMDKVTDDLEVKTRLEPFIDFIISIRSKKEGDQLRVINSFLLSDDKFAFRLIENIIRSAKSQSVKKAAITALIQISPDNAVDPILWLLKREEDTSIRNTIFKFLRGRNDEKVFLALADLIKKGDSELRKMTLETLVVFNDYRVPGIIEPFLESLNSEERYIAIEALKKLNKVDLTDIFKKAVYSRDSMVRLEAVKWLHQNPDTRALKALTKALSDPQSQIRHEAFLALCGITDVRIIRPLMDSFGNGAFSGMDWQLSQVCKEIGKEAVPVILEYIAHPSDKVRIAAISALGAIKHKETEECIVKALNDNADLVRCKAAWALGEIEGINSEDALIIALKDKNDRVRYNAAKALGKSNSESAIEALINLFDDSCSDVRYIATRALAEMPYEKSLPFIIEHLSKGDFLNQRYCIQLLGKIAKKSRDIAATKVLVKILLESDIKGSRIEAARVLGDTDESSVMFLVSALGDGDVDICVAAIESLGKIGGEDAVYNVKAMLNDKRPLVRMKALESLQYMIEIECAEFSAIRESILQKLKDKNESVRATALNVLVELTVSDYVQVDEICGFLLIMLKDRSPEVRNKVVDAISVLAHEDYLQTGKLTQYFKLALTDKNYKIRKNVLSSLEDMTMWVIENEKKLEILRLALKDEFPDIRKTAIDIIAEVVDGDNSNNDEILSILKEMRNDKSSFVREAVLKAIALKSKLALVPILCEALEDKSMRVRKTAISLLDDLDSSDYGGISFDDEDEEKLDEKAVNAILKSLNCEDAEYIAKAGGLLAEINSEKAFDALFKSYLKVLKSNQTICNSEGMLSEYLESIRNSLIRLARNDILSLAKFLNSRDSIIHTNAVDIIVELASGEETPGLLSVILKDSSINDFNEVARKLACRNINNIWAVLLPGLKENDPEVKRAISAAFCCWHPEEDNTEIIEKALVLTILKANRTNRLNAITYVRNTWDHDVESIVKALITATNDKDCVIREEASSALMEISECEFYDNHELWKKWYQENYKPEYGVENIAGERP